MRRKWDGEVPLGSGWVSDVKGSGGRKEKRAGRYTIACEHIGIVPSFYHVRLVFGRFIRSKASQGED